MEKQYSVKFFASFLEALQKVCRDFVDFDDSIELSGYLSLEIDNVKKERYVLSEMLNSSGNVISESYCTKAFKTVRKYQQPSGRENITPRSQTISNRSQAFISESQNQNSSSSMFNYKDHTPDSRMSKQWSQDMYGTNSHMSPLRGSGQQFGDGVGIHGMKSSNQKRSLSTIVIDDPPSNKRGRSDSVPDDKLLSETSSQHGTCKLDTDAMQATFSNSSQSQSTTHLPTTSSSLQHQTNNSIASHSSSQPASESIRLPLPVTIKDEPDIPCVDIDLSELDSADSMGGSDSGSGYPSQEGTSGPYRMAEGSHGAHDQYQNSMWSFSHLNRRRSRAMQSALTAVEEGLLTVSSAARVFGLTQSAVYYKVKHQGLLPQVRRGVQPELVGPMKTRLEELLALCNEEPDP
ncbi:uncharacterized protein LOC121383526 isoform X10 [Gigantopelta aegis]|uniref:uncharacterized protein LOC121383526 isoform X10 n=1 Tax=Gigantopelta aegis TaxID=1735272 RepID=UPI001B8877FD|nr:uncharacterized protein LOC121383526 isoform X10 [Gigantopelta aegis]XP_041369542.1 uncharacterized protein LOC121383526 isoform X10 [Gigantopelta aegis]